MNTKSLTKWTLAALIASAIIYTTAPILPAADPAPATRTTPQILTELQSTQDQLDKVLKPLPEMFDDKTRAAVAPQALPLLRKDIALVDELSGPSMAEQALHAKMQFLLIGTFLGDADMEKQLTALTTNSNPAVAREAQLTLATANWWKNHSDAAAQGKILDQLQALAKATPTDDVLADTLSTMEKLGPATPELAQRAHSIIVNDLKGPLAQKIQSSPAIGAPLSFTALTADGKTFNSADWKGKVILVDFWATWCGPCVADMPEVKKLYQTYHDQGLEIVGMDCDYDVEKFKAFLAKNEIPWPQLRDDSKQKTPETQMHELFTKYGLEGIPTGLVIDRNGNLRDIYVGSGHTEREAEIKKLIEEKAVSVAK